jgi:SAM-dependent methyltransferase
MIYNDYAPIYDAIGQGAFAEALTARILANLPEPPRRALDLACGTGAAALALSAAGVQTVGVDRSPRMLAIARARARDRGLPITFIEADLRYLPIKASRTGSDEASSLILYPASFDLITALYDSLNYLQGDDDLAMTIAGAAALLVPGGRLVFDLNTEHEYATWDDSDQVVHDAGGILVYNRLSYDPTTYLAHGRIVWFSRDGERWWRGEETHVERAWSDAEVQAALAAAGLTLVARRTPRWEPAPTDAHRVVYEAAHMP